MTKPTGKPRGRPRKDGRPAATVGLRKPPTPPPQPPKRAVGRQTLYPDLEGIKRAAAIGCTLEEIATVIGFSLYTLRDRLKDTPKVKDALEHGQREGRATLRRHQWQAAVKGNVTMLIWLGKNMLGQTDKHEATVVTAEELRRIADVARSEAARRGIDIDLAEQPVDRTLPN